MKVELNLTDNELRALNTCLFYGSRSCNSCCVYPEMQDKKTNCDNCNFTRGRYSVQNKINKELEDERN